MRKTSDILKDVHKKKHSQKSEDYILFSEIIFILNERGFVILLLLFSLPLSIPVPVPPGYTSVLSIPLIILSMQLLFGKETVWLPQFIADRKIKRSILAKIFEKTSPIVIAIEKVSKARFMFATSSTMEKLYAFISFICSLFIFLPIPFTNFIPAIGISLMSIGFLNKDGFIVLSGILASILGIFIAVMVLIIGNKFLEQFFSWF